MADDDEEEQRLERARRLRAAMDKAGKPGARPRPSTPREFIQEKMREQSAADEKDAGDDDPDAPERAGD